jgi:hypothetical protein
VGGTVLNRLSPEQAAANLRRSSILAETDTHSKRLPADSATLRCSNPVEQKSVCALHLPASFARLILKVRQTNRIVLTPRKASRRDYREGLNSSLLSLCASSRRFGGDEGAGNRPGSSRVHLP